MKRARFFVGDPVIGAGGRAGNVTHVLAGGFVHVTHADGSVKIARDTNFRDKPLTPNQIGSLVSFHEVRGSGIFPIYRYGHQPWLQPF